MTYLDYENNEIQQDQQYYIIGKEAHTITGVEAINLIENDDDVCVVNTRDTSAYFICNDCRRVFSYEEYEHHELSNGNYICDGCYCYNNYSYCNDCGYVFRDDDIRYCDDDDEYYCYNCIDNHTRNDDESIHSYHYHKGNEHFLSTNDDNTSLYFGMELEVEKSNYSISNDSVASYIYNNICDKVYFESDGSLRSGFEIITHPFTFNYWRDVLSNEYKTMCDYLVDNGYKSNDTTTCGLHVHISKKALGDNEQEINDNINKIILFSEYYKDDIVKLARRGSCHYMQFLSDYLIENGYIQDKIYAQSIKEIDKQKDNTRYYAINNTNNNTLEFRIFRGTLRYNTIYAYIEFINNLVDTIKKYPLNKISFSKVVNANKTIYLKEYLKERGINYTSKYMIDSTNKMIKLHNKRLKALKLLNSNLDLLFSDFAQEYTKQIKDFLKVDNMYNKVTKIKSYNYACYELYDNKMYYDNRYKDVVKCEFINQSNIKNVTYYIKNILSDLRQINYTNNKIDLIQKQIKQLEVI